MVKTLSEAQKLDILLGFSREYNLKEVENDPATYIMDCGTGYTLFASILRSWVIEFNDGVEKTKYDIESPKVPYTNAQDARTLCKKYRDECKRVLGELNGGKPRPVQPETPKIDPEIEEKNRLEREANIKRLAEAEEAMQQEQEELEKLQKEKEVPLPPNNESYDEPEDLEEEVPPVKTGEVKLLDILYNLIEDDLLQIFGHTGTGKTSIAMKAAIEGREAKKSVLYIDTEHNITKNQAASIKKLGIKYEYIPKFENLYNYVKKIPKYDIVVIDSLGLPVLALFADASMKDKGTALMKMIAMSAFLKNYANDNHSLVIVLNQPESDMNKDPNTERKPFGDKSSYCYKEIISSKFARGGRTEKKTTIVVKAFRSRSCGMGTKLFTVEITDDGIKVIQ